MSYHALTDQEPKFKLNSDVQYQGEIWHVASCAGGPLLGFKYCLTGEGDKQLTVSEEELEAANQQQ